MDWYIDAWAVRDGMAFTSQRRSGDLQGAQRTIFFAVPNLEAIPIGRVSTGLWATRANFQDGFHDANGEEIGFEDLDSVKELVRRAYLAGGVGPGPGAALAPQQPAPRDRPDAGESYWEDGIKQLGAVHKWFPGSAGIGAKLEREHVFGQLLKPPAVEGLNAYLRLFAEATLALWVEQLQHEGAADEELDTLGRWQSLLLATGLWDSPDHLLHALEKTRTLEFWHKTDAWFKGPVVPRTWSIALESPTHEENVLAVPCPLREHWHRGIRRLSDKIYLATSTHDYFDINPNLPEFIPSLLGALTIVTQSQGPLRTYGMDARRQRLKASLDWLSDQMPQMQLPSAAEEALRSFAWNELPSAAG
jgi:hypothetical protein